jgi:lipid II:glycine glycyltransferase (peptidoglycan interpeptide bridge formation enzyme)
MNSSRYEVQIGGVTESGWSALLPAFRDATLHQTWSSGRIQVGDKNLRHVIVRDGADAVALAQVMLRKLPLIPAGLATVYWGPIWRRKDRPADPRVLDRVIDALKEEYAAKQGLLLRVWPVEYGIPGSDEVNNTTFQFERKGFQLNLNVSPFQTLIVDLTPSEELLRKNLDHKWRNQLNAAEKADLQLKTGTSDEMYETFYSLLNEMVARKKFSSNVDYRRFERLQKDLPEPLKMRIFICESQGAPVAAGVYSAIGSMGVYLLGATATKGLKLNGSNLIQWNVLKWLKQQGCDSYDLGGIDAAGNPGVYKFKKGIAGKTGKEVRHVGQFYAATTLRARLLHFLLNRRFGPTATLRRVLTPGSSARLGRARENVASTGS